MINGNDDRELAIAERQTQTGGDWFFWIAGFSIVNSIISLTGTNWHFVIGLGTTELFDGVAGQGGTTAKIVALLLDVIAAGFYVLYGAFARKGAKWAFITGILFYALDGLLLLVFRDWLSAAFHAYALYRIFGGFQAAQRLGVLRAAYPGDYAPPPSTPGNDVWPPPPSV